MIDFAYIRAAENVAGGHVSVEPDGTVWTGTEDDKTFIDTAAVQTEYERIISEKEAARAASLAKLEALGLTPDDLAALIG